ncbi:MAG TPA: hypothetical protein VGE08_13570 [Steroidobacter sp.]|uniref:hypothetical protein n=1 Tax=Steroidobacter sp. TaxID=1978227 RepID=UPI002EDB47C2
MNRSYLGSCVRSALAIAALVGAAMAQAQQAPVQPTRGGQPLREHSFDIGLLGGINWSDNIRRTAVDEDEGTYSRTAVLLTYERQSQRLNASVNADVGYEYYFDDEFDSDVVGGLDGTAVFGVVPGRFEWFVQDNFGQVTTDPFAAVTPETRENVNYFTTGPDVFVRLGSVTRLRVNGRYSNINYERSPFDHDRIGGGVGIERELSSSSVASLNLRTDRTEYDANVPDVDYDRDEASLGFIAQGARTRANLEVGYTRLTALDSDRESSGLLLRLSLDRQLTQASQLGLTLGREFSDAGDVFRLQQSLTGVSQGTQTVLPSSDPFTNEYVTLHYQLVGRRSGMGAGVAHFEETYEGAGNADRTRLLVDASIYRELSANTRVELLGRREEDDARNIPGDYVETSGALGFSWQASRKLSFNLQIERVDRNSELAGGGYVENRAWLGVRYGHVLARGQVGGLQ